MNQIHIITDAGSDIVNPDRADLTILPMTIRFGDEEFQDGVNLTHRQFYEKLIENDTLPTTSQPSPFLFENAIRSVLEKGDIPLIITISSKLSGTWAKCLHRRRGNLRKPSISWTAKASQSGKKRSWNMRSA